MGRPPAKPPLKGAKKPMAVRLREGTRVNVEWPRDGRWLPGYVKKYDAKKALHTIVCDQGDVRRADLRVVRWELEAVDGRTHQEPEGAFVAGGRRRKWNRSSAPRSGDDCSAAAASGALSNVDFSGEDEPVRGLVGEGDVGCGILSPSHRLHGGWASGTSSEADSGGDGEVVGADDLDDDDNGVPAGAGENSRPSRPHSPPNFFPGAGVSHAKGHTCQATGGGANASRAIAKQSLAAAAALVESTPDAFFMGSPMGHLDFQNPVSPRSIAELERQEKARGGDSSPLFRTPRSTAKTVAAAADKAGGRKGGPGKKRAGASEREKREKSPILKRPVGRPPKVRSGLAAIKYAQEIASRAITRMARENIGGTFSIIPSTIPFVEELQLIFAVSRRLKNDRKRAPAGTPASAEMAAEVLSGCRFDLSEAREPCPSSADVPSAPLHDASLQLRTSDATPPPASSPDDGRSPSYNAARAAHALSHAAFARSTRPSAQREGVSGAAAVEEEAAALSLSLPWRDGRDCGGAGEASKCAESGFEENGSVPGRWCGSNFTAFESSSAHLEHSARPTFVPTEPDHQPDFPALMAVAAAAAATATASVSPIAPMRFSQQEPWGVAVLPGPLTV